MAENILFIYKCKKPLVCHGDTIGVLLYKFNLKFFTHSSGKPLQRSDLLIYIQLILKSSLKNLRKIYAVGNSKFI